MAVINGEERAVTGTLLAFLEAEGFVVDRVAVEVNGTILHRQSFGTYVLQPEDKIEIVCFVGGG